MVLFYVVPVKDLADVVVDVWKDRNVFKRLRGHLSDLEKSKKSYAGEVEVMVWTPPTWTRRRLFEGWGR